MNPPLIIVGLFCFLASAGSLYRSRTLPAGKKVGARGIYIDKSGYRWQSIIGFTLALIVLTIGLLV
jgi:hypothetical protein